MWKWAIIGALVVTPASAQETLNANQMRALPPKALDKRARQDLLSVLQPVHQLVRGMIRGLREVPFVTRPYGTHYDGLCRRDALYLKYVRLGESKTPEDALAQPYGFEATTSYHLYRLPKDRDGDDAKARSYIFDSTCDSLADDENANWYTADDTDSAAMGAMVLQAALDAIKSGQLKPTCSKYFDRTGKDCVAGIAKAFSLASIASISNDGQVIDSGGSKKLLPPGEAQWTIQTGGEVMSVQVKVPLAPKIEVRAVDVDVYIIVT